MGGGRTTPSLVSMMPSRTARGMVEVLDKTVEAQEPVCGQPDTTPLM